MQSAEEPFRRDTRRAGESPADLAMPLINQIGILIYIIMRLDKVCFQMMQGRYIYMTFFKFYISGNMEL